MGFEHKFLCEYLLLLGYSIGNVTEYHFIFFRMRRRQTRIRIKLEDMHQENRKVANFPDELKDVLVVAIWLAHGHNQLMDLF